MPPDPALLAGALLALLCLAIMAAIAVKCARGDYDGPTDASDGDA